MPKISVIMPVYNGGKYFKEAVESISKQTYKDFELIIINDGSTDDSLQVLNKLAEGDGRIKIISRENKGIVHSLNEGVKLSQGQYIARMDADDVSMPERLEKQINFMESNQDLVLCGTWAKKIDETGNKIGEYKVPVTSSEIRKRILFHNPFIHPSVMFRKDVFENVGGYNSFFKYIEDYELWTRLVFRHKTDNLPEMLLKYRIQGGQLTKKNNLEMRIRGLLVRLMALSRFVFRS